MLYFTKLQQKEGTFMFYLESWELCGWQPEWWRAHYNDEKNFLNYMDMHSNDFIQINQ